MRNVWIKPKHTSIYTFKKNDNSEEGNSKEGKKIDSSDEDPGLIMLSKKIRYTSSYKVWLGLETVPGPVPDVLQVVGGQFVQFN